MKFFERLQLMPPSGPFRSLLVSRVVSSAGTWLAAVGLSVQALRETHSATWVALILLSDFAPSLILGLFLGPLLDRGPRKRIMISSELVNMCAFALLVLANSPLQLFVLALVAGTANGFFVPSQNAALPLLVTDEELPRANSLLQTADNYGRVLSPALGGVIIAIDGPRFVFALNAVSFLFSVYFLARIPATRLQKERAPSEGHWRDVLAGFSALRAVPVLLAVICTWSVAAFGFSLANVGDVIMSLNVFSAGSIGLGVLLTSVSAGSLIGALAAPKLIAWQGLRLYWISLACMSIVTGFSVVPPLFWPVCVLIFIQGFANGVAIACNSLLFLRGAPEAMRGRVIATLMGVINVAALLGLIVGGQLSDHFGGRATWLGAAILMALAAACGRILAPREFPVTQPPTSEATDAALATAP